MGISISEYRFKIGMFQQQPRVKSRKMKSPNQSLKMNAKKCSVVLLIFSVLLHQMNVNCNNLNKNVSNVKSSSKDNGPGRPAFYTFSWAQSGPSINKIQKIIDGN